jgi:hypothetical protein
MASNKTRTQLKAYFETGDKPTQGQFADLIESNVNLTDATTVTGDLCISSSLLQISSSNITTRGAGAATGSAFHCKLAHINGETITTILVDLEGMKSKNDTDDIIGIAGTISASLMRWDTAKHGILYKVEMACIETPAGGEPDIDLRANTFGEATYDTDGSSYTLLVSGGGDWAVGRSINQNSNGGLHQQTQLVTNDHIYLAAGSNGADAVYTAGKFIIKFYGVKADFS